MPSVKTEQEISEEEGEFADALLKWSRALPEHLLGFEAWQVMIWGEVRYEASNPIDPGFGRTGTARDGEC